MQKCILLPGVPQVRDTSAPSHPCEKKKRLITFFHCSVVQVSCAHCYCFWTGVSMATLTGLQLCCPMHNKLWCSVYSDTFLPEPAVTFSIIWATVARLLERTSQASLHSLCASVSLGFHDPVNGSPLFWPLQTGNIPQELEIWRCPKLAQSSGHHSLNLVKLTQILTLSHFPCF